MDYRSRIIIKALLLLDMDYRSRIIIKADMETYQRNLQIGSSKEIFSEGTFLYVGHLVSISTAMFEIQCASSKKMYRIYLQTGQSKKKEF